MNGPTERPGGEAGDDIPETETETETETDNTESCDDDAVVELTLEDVQALADENWDRYLRASAEVENVRKRATRDVEHARKYALESFGKELLGVKDSLEMGLAAEDSDSLRSGSQATLKLFATVLERFGVVEVNPEGEPFDPELHEAMTVQASADAEPGSILTVVQKGYTLNGRLLRPARVIVAAEVPDQPGDE